MRLNSPQFNLMYKACLKASKVLIRDFGEIEKLQVSEKGPGDFVTASDKRAEKIIIGELEKSEYSFLTEESGVIEGKNKDVASDKAVQAAGVEFEYLSDKNLQVLEIPPYVYHGYRALIPGTILMYYITEKYEEISKYDDERVPIGYFGENWGTPNK